MKTENQFRSSHELYIILNNDGTIYVTQNKDYKLYKTKRELIKRKEKYIGKKIAVFKLSDIKNIEDI